MRKWSASAISRLRCSTRLDKVKREVVMALEKARFNRAFSHIRLLYVLPKAHPFSSLLRPYELKFI